MTKACLPPSEASPPPTVFDWLLVQSVAVLIPTFALTVAVFADCEDIFFYGAVRSAVFLHVPCAIYVSVWGEMILEERSPGRRRIILGIVLFIFVLLTMAFGMWWLSDNGAKLDEEWPWWALLQLIIAISILSHGVFEKSVMMNSRCTDFES